METVLKEGRGASGVEFRWNDKAEYSKLNEEQKVELREWRKTSDKGKGNSKKDGKKGNGTSPKKKSTKSKFKAQISSLEKKFEDKLEELSKKFSNGTAAVSSIEGQPAEVSATNGQKKMSLTSILKRNDVQVGSVTMKK